jgi:7,8-dihydropterin-6-yl-methyl-4-(beta-D-ribofuranosyl)aminobenzene 5'-phosphate synthase
LSVLVTARLDDREHTVLFDTGPRADVWLANAAELGIDLGAIDAVVLSHWHWDHSGGLPGVVAAIAAARSAAGAPPPVIDVHPDRPDQRGAMTATGMLALLPPEPTLDALADAGGIVELHARPHLVAGGLVLVSGEIPRTTRYETGLPGHHSIRAGVVEPDPLIADERLLAAHVAGRGVTVISACSHAGVVNACLHAIDTFSPAPIDVVLGGYHLAGGTMEARIDATVADLLTLVDPTLLAPGHCTGWRAKAAFATVFGPQRYGPSVVGTRYRLQAARDATEAVVTPR